MISRQLKSFLWAALLALAPALTGCGGGGEDGDGGNDGTVDPSVDPPVDDGRDAVPDEMPDADVPDDQAADEDGPGPDGAWRPFSDVSPWNTRIPPDPELEPESAALVEDFMTSSPWGVHLDVNIPGYSIPLYWADSSTPTYTVLADYGGDGWVGDNGANATGTMPIPGGATPDTESDHHFLVVDRALGTEWGCWNMVNEGGSWHAGLCATADLFGTGVRVPATEADPWYRAHGARACGFPLVAGLIRVEEIEAGRIDHALVVAYPHIRSGWFTSPASTGQARVDDEAISTRGVPCGGRFQFDPGIDLDTLGLSRSGRIIMLALQEYGAYVGDYSGALSLYAENSPEAQATWAGGVLDSYELLDKIDLSQFRVIRLGTLYDYGNGD